MNNDILTGFYIGCTLPKIKKIRSQMKVNKDNKDFEANKELQIKLNHKIAVFIFSLRSKLVGDKFEKGKTPYRFNKEHYGKIYTALNELCYNSFKQESKCLNAFIESIKNAVINIRED